MGWHDIAPLFSFASLLNAILLSTHPDLRLEKSYLVSTSMFKVRKVDLTNLEIRDIKIYNGPTFSLTTNKDRSENFLYF